MIHKARAIACFGACLLLAVILFFPACSQKGVDGSGSLSKPETSEDKELKSQIARKGVSGGPQNPSSRSKPDADPQSRRPSPQAEQKSPGLRKAMDGKPMNQPSEAFAKRPRESSPAEQSPKPASLSRKQDRDEIADGGANKVEPPKAKNEQSSRIAQEKPQNPQTAKGEESQMQKASKEVAASPEGSSLGKKKSATVEINAIPNGKGISPVDSSLPPQMAKKELESKDLDKARKRKPRPERNANEKEKQKPQPSKSPAAGEVAQSLQFSPHQPKASPALGLQHVKESIGLEVSAADAEPMHRASPQTKDSPALVVLPVEDFSQIEAPGGFQLAWDRDSLEDLTEEELRVLEVEFERNRPVSSPSDKKEKLQSASEQGESARRFEALREFLKNRIQMGADSGNGGNQNVFQRAEGWNRDRGAKWEDDPTADDPTVRFQEALRWIRQNGRQGQ